MKPGYQPNCNSGYQPEKSIKTDPPHLGTSAKKSCQSENKATIAYIAGNLFDPNEKDPAMRALNMVKEYCNNSIKKMYSKEMTSLEFTEAGVYRDVMNFIGDHQRKCHEIVNQEVQSSVEDGSSEYYMKKMQLYRESFFRICDIVKHSDCADIIKKLVEEERKKY